MYKGLERMPIVTHNSQVFLRHSSLLPRSHTHSIAALSTSIGLATQSNNSIKGPDSVFQFGSELDPGIMTNRSSRSVWVTVAVLATMAVLMPMLATAADADPLQDFCVADNSTEYTINGFPCKPAAQVTVSDFVSRALVYPGDTSNVNYAKVTPASVKEFAGLNTLGISAARIDFAKGGINPPHTHPRATELLILAKGELYVGFVDTTAPTPRLFATTLRAGELFVFPKALVHFQLNVGKGPALAFAALSSQNPGVQQVAAALFTPKDLDDEVLEKGFRISEQTVDLIQKEFQM